MKRSFKVSSLFQVSSLEEPFRDPHGAGKATLRRSAVRTPSPVAFVCAPRGPQGARPKPRTPQKKLTASVRVPNVSGPTWLQKWSFFGAVLRGSQDAPKMPPRSAPRRLNSTPRRPKRRPRRPKRLSRRPKRPSRRPKRLPRRLQDGPRPFQDPSGTFKNQGILMEK